jgi:BirA family transcriptional regulator, biotin operon repressor / biotin---[acetyl-CoA-carboxylase] ligase
MERECKKTSMIQGIPVYHYGKVVSTMDIAEDILSRGKTGIVVATEQTNGKGRYGRVWFSQTGGLYFSWILKSKEVPHLSEILSLTTVKTLYFFGITCRIQMPNDIITEGKKIAGILIIKKGDTYIAGVGINVNNDVGELSERISVKQSLDKEIETGIVLEQFIKIFLISKKYFVENERLSLQDWSEYLIK